jgi:hypothetical protein
MKVSAVEFHIKRKVFSVDKVFSKGDLSLVRRVSQAFRGRLPDEEYYFDELAKGLRLERVGIGVAAMKEIGATVTKERERMKKALLPFLKDKEAVSKLVSRIDAFDTSTKNVYLLHGPPPAVVCEVGPGRLVAITKDNESAARLVNDVRAELARISKRVEFSGYALDRIRTGNKIVEALVVENPDVVRAVSGKSKSAFEKTVLSEIERVTASFIPNLTVKFRKTSDTEEYDALVALGPDQVFDIEATDYTSVTAEIERARKNLPFLKQTLKAAILVRCQQKAARVDAMGVIVAKGFPGSLFKALNSIANEMPVVLTDEASFHDTLEELLVFSTLRKTTERTPLRSPEKLAQAMKQGRFQA